MNLSSINYQEEPWDEIKDLDAQTGAHVDAFSKTCFLKKQFITLPKDIKEIPLLSFLNTTSTNIMLEYPDIVNLKNIEKEFRSKHVLPLLRYIFVDIDQHLSVHCDVPSKAYTNTNKTIRADFTVYYKDIELVIVEAKPFNTDKRLVELDEARLGELAKKLLHKRMATAKTSKEFKIFTIRISGSNMDLFTMEFKKGEYIYTKVLIITLPTLSSTYSHMKISLSALLEFKQFVLDSLPSEEDID